MTRLERESCTAAWTWTTVVLLSLIPLIPGEADAKGVPFPPRGDDLTTSLGSFRIAVDPQFDSLVAGYPGYDAATGRLDSPTLFDTATQIGRSDPITQGSAEDSGGVPVGTAGTLVKDGDFLAPPDGFQGSAGTREVHTQITNINLDGAVFGAPGVHVRAGTSAPGRPACLGEVESLDSSGRPDRDFPAKSFFNVFVEVDIPGLGNLPSATLYNQAPLIVENSLLTTFPPTVVYMHGGTSAVPILFKDDNPGFWRANDRFGFLVLAGHGVGYVATGHGHEAEPTEVQFEAEVHSHGEIPVPVVVPVSFKRGDVNGDSVVDLSDAVAILSFLYLGQPPKLNCEKSADVDDTGDVHLLDAVYLLRYLYVGGPDPIQPFLACGAESGNALPCDSFQGCP